MSIICIEQTLIQRVLIVSKTEFDNDSTSTHHSFRMIHFKQVQVYLCSDKYLGRLWFLIFASAWTKTSGKYQIHEGIHQHRSERQQNTIGAISTSDFIHRTQHSNHHNHPRNINIFKKVHHRVVSGASSTAAVLFCDCGCCVLVVCC